MTHTTDTQCKCIINPDTEQNHNCDVNGCTSINHYRKGCDCTNIKGQHDNQDCRFCTDTQKETWKNRFMNEFIIFEERSYSLKHMTSLELMNFIQQELDTALREQAENIFGRMDYEQETDYNRDQYTLSKEDYNEIKSKYLPKETENE